MKKIIIAIALLISILSFNLSAQPKATKTKTEKTIDIKLKKDGTPDKRYKNAEPEKKGPTKKDGTLDKRFKKNKSK
jgi:hypothetical protein